MPGLAGQPQLTRGHKEGNGSNASGRPTPLPRRSVIFAAIGAEAIGLFDRVIWGWAEPSEEVTISFHGEKLKAKTDKNGSMVDVCRAVRCWWLL